MEPILLVLVLAALTCPITMFGPTLWARLRGRPGAGGMSCTGMMSGQEPRAGIEELRAQRAELDREIALLASAQEASRRPAVTQDSQERMRTMAASEEQLRTRSHAHAGGARRVALGVGEHSS